MKKSENAVIIVLLLICYLTYRRAPLYVAGLTHGITFILTVLVYIGRRAAAASGRKIDKNVKDFILNANRGNDE